jgi:hypothetical protein
MRIKVALSLVLTALFALFAAGSAQAALTVTNTNDSGAGSLRQAIAEAGSGETINVPAGTYTLTSAPLKFEKKSLTIAGHDDADTIIRAGAAIRIFEVLEGNLAISGVTIRDGNLTSGIRNGAGIYAIQTGLSLSGVTVTANTANANGAPGNDGSTALGAGIWLVEGSLSLNDCQVTGNTATAVGASGKKGGVADGGGIWAVAKSVTVVNSTISGNVLDARGGSGPTNASQGGGVAQGAGMWIVEGDVQISNSRVTNNTSLVAAGSGAKGGVAQGGGLWLVGKLSASNTLFNSNSLDTRGGQGPSAAGQAGGTAQGGGIWVVEGALNLGNVEVSGNSALASGGAGGDGGVSQGGGLWSVQSEKGVPSSVLGSTFANNLGDGSAGAGGKNGVVQGGGVWESSEGGPLPIANSTIASNVARHSTSSGGAAMGGGAWMIGNKTDAIELLGTTIAGNRLETAGTGFAEGGNLLWFEKVTIRNSIVANGVGPAGSENCNKHEEAETAGFSLGFNLESLNQCGFKAAGDQVNKDPLLGPLQSNGGLTQTMAPALGSPAIDQGKSFGLTSDQRGIVRPIDLPSIPNSAAAGADGSDVGAVELQPSNAFTLGKLKRNKKKGTATLAVLLPQPSAGTLTLTGKGLKTQTLAIAGQTEVKLKVAAKSKAIKKALRKKGRRKVGINVTYAPTGNSAATQSRKAKLIKKKKRKRHRKHHKPAKS